MRRRAVKMVLRAVLTAVLLLGVPLLVLAPAFTYWKAQSEVERYADSLAAYLGDTTYVQNVYIKRFLDGWTSTATSLPVHVDAKLANGFEISSGDEIKGPIITSTAVTQDGSVITVFASTTPIIRDAFISMGLVLIVVLVAVSIAFYIAEREARRLSAPLIYLAAQAEQIGTGQVRARIKPSGIEEIDLVQAELERTARAMAGRLAAERQFASDASHQLRTPLTALSMRLEEIQLISTEEEVQHEAEVCLEQVERLTGVVTDLLQSSQSSGNSNKQAVSVNDIMAQQRNEWEKTFKKLGRQLVVDDPENVVMLGTPGYVSQAIATLIENSLKYGAGQVTVTAKYIGRKMAVLTVSDEGEGVSEEIAPRVFEKGVSGFGSTGIGLALASDLIKSDGGRLELTQRKPPVFTITLPAVAKNMDPDRVLPVGTFLSVGPRRRRI